jgi:hypothetical protein
MNRRLSSVTTPIAARWPHWRDPLEFMYHYSTKWAPYVLGLKAWVEGGEVKPNPHDMQFSNEKWRGLVTRLAGTQL